MKCMKLIMIVNVLVMVMRREGVLLCTGCGTGVLGESGSGQVSPGQLGSGQLKLFFMASLTSTALVRALV